MTSRTTAFTHVLFKNSMNNELMIAPVEKCNIHDDHVGYTCGTKFFDGELFTIGPKSLCDKLMKQMNGHSTDYLYSSLPEEEEEDDDDDDNLLANGKGTQIRKRKKKNQKTNSKYLKDNHSELRRRLFQKADTNPVSIRTSSIITRPLDHIANNNENEIIIEDIGNHEAVPLHNDPIESFLSNLVNDFVSNPPQENSIDLPSISTAASDLGSVSASQNLIRTKKSSTIEQSHRKKAQIPFLPSSSSSSTKLSPADRLTNIEQALNNLISCVNTLVDDVAAIAHQLKPLSKNVKYIQNHIVPRNAADVLTTSPSLRSSNNDSSSTTMASNNILMFKNTNLMELKHDLTSIRSFLRKMTMRIYTRKEILLNKHSDAQDDRFKIITDALAKGFALNEEAMVALHVSLKQARTQLSKDVKYLKVMKPNLNGDVVNEDGNATEEDVESAGDNTQTQPSDEE